MAGFARLLGSEREKRIAFTRSPRIGDFPEEHHDEKKDQRDADDDREQEDVHGFAGAGWLAGNVVVEAGGTVDAAAFTPACEVQRQLRQRVHFAGGVWVCGVDLRFIDAA